MFSCKFRFGHTFIFATLTLFFVANLAKAEICPSIDGLTDVNCDGKLVIECFGDSITYGRGDSLHKGYPGRLKKYFPSAIVRNYGKPGEHTIAGKLRAQQLFKTHTDADYVIVLEGVNDYWDKGHSSNITKLRLYKILDTAAKNGAIALLGSLTRVSRKYQTSWVSGVNNRIKKQVDIDFYQLRKIVGSDGLHPTKAGYDKMAALVTNKLLDLAQN